MRRFTQGLAGYAVALLTCLAAAGLFLLVTPQSRTEHIPRVDYSIDQAAAIRAAPYQVEVPGKPLRDWIPTSSTLTRDDSTVTWRLGFATGNRKHALLAQSNERPYPGFANRMANSDRRHGIRLVGGVRWEERFRPDKNQRSLVRITSDHATVVTGSADWPELVALAASLTSGGRPLASTSPG